ncbi:hypothetical protein A1332_19345 [Methylomonas methanica]|uniref:Uncharacterized protein n=4 Tax=Methylomonas TaxID=416 RepID=A0A177M3W1_METMH|nr:hypothetical protein A1332_19345 [Methylomonas methanica]
MTKPVLFMRLVANIIPIKTHTRRKDMNNLSEEERQKILQSSPVGTWALMLIVGGGMVVAWLLMYYGIFLPRGHIG